MGLKPYLLHHLLEHSASIAPDKVAIKHKQRSITFHNLYEESLKIKSFLIASGITKGDRVGIYLDKSIEQVFVMFGISMAGGVFVFINSVLKKQQVEYIINDCQIKMLITTTSLKNKNNLEGLCSFLYVNEPEKPESQIFWQDARNQIKPDYTEVGRIPDDISCLIYTSGSTGLPKGVVVPHRTVVDGAKIVSSYLGITGEDRLISVLPFNFDYGLNQVTSSVLHGATLVMHQFFLAKDLLKVLQEEKITGFAGLNPIWVKLFNTKYELHTDFDFPHLRYVTNTGGKVPRSIVAKMRDFFPHTKIFLMYGLTEAFRSTFLPPDEIDKRPESMGKAIPNVEIMVLRRDGTECTHGEPGELVHRGALVTKGYWNDPEKTNKVFRKNPLLGNQNHLHEIVVFSGDLVKKDEDGFLYFISRRDEMIKALGYRVSPTEVEELLIEIPGINHAVVFGKELQNGDQGIIAVLETEHVPADNKIVMQECRKRLPGYMVPYRIFFEKSFKRSANDKIDRAFLKDKWLSVEDHDEA